MVKRFVLFALASLLFCATTGSRLSAADDPFTIELSVRADSQQQPARGRSTSATGSNPALPIMTVKPKTGLRVRWSVVNQEKMGTVQDVTVHFFLETEDSIGQPGAPKPGPDAVYESAVMMDFAAQAKSSGDFVIEAPPPGNYLLRIETMGAAKARRDDYFAAMDVKVVP